MNIDNNETMNFNSCDNLKLLGSRFGYKYSGKVKLDSDGCTLMFRCKTHFDHVIEVSN